MNEKSAPKINPIQKHHRQAAWQIWLPVCLVGAAYLALCVLAVLLTYSSAPGEAAVGKNWGALSTIWWILPSCVGGLISLALVVGCAYGAGKALGGLPILAGKIQKAFDQLSTKVKEVSDKAARPVIKVGGWQAAAKTGWESATGKKNRPAEEK